MPRRTAKGDINPAQEAILLKFLRDARWNPNEAATKLAATLKWRVDFKLENLNKEKWSEELFRACYSYGVDRLGNPILYTNYSLLSKLSLVADPEKFLRWRVHVLEKALSKANFEQGAEKVTQIFDWSGVGLFLDSKISESNNRLAAICRSYYPECFEYKAQVNVSGLKEFLINIGKFFAPLDNSKNIAITPQNLRKALLEIISPDSIIPEYNGFDPLPSGTESIVFSQNILAGKTFSHEFPANKGDIIHYSYICKQGDITGSYGFKKEGKKFLDDKNQIAKKESGKGIYEVERKGAFVLSFSNEDPNGSKDIYFRAAIVPQDDSKTEKKKSKKDKKEDRKSSKSQKAATEDEGESEN